MSFERCWACNGRELQRFFEVESAPVHCNLLSATSADAARVARGDIRLVICPSCGMIFNTAFEESRLSYGPGYETSLHFSPRFQGYVRELAERLVTDCSLEGKTILEIGCGGGEFLHLLCAGGRARGIGFDMSHQEEYSPSGGDIRIERQPFSSGDPALAADFICSRHVLEHIPEPLSFLAQIHTVAERRRGCTVFWEVPNALFTLRDLGIWDIIYEHCSYFTEPSLAQLIDAAGFRAQRVRTAFGDQFLCLEASVDGTGHGRAHPNEIGGLLELAQGFAEHHRRKVDAWAKRLHELNSKGQRLVVWGAGSKGTTFLNTVPGGADVECVVDVSPRKQGKFVPGTAQRIEAPEKLRGEENLVVLVMNSLYRGEIQQMLGELDVHAEIATV